MGLVDSQATKDILSLSTEQFYISGEWSIGHALDIVQKTKIWGVFLKIFASFTLN